MGYSIDNYRNQEIRDMYYIIFNNRIKEGCDEKIAKRIAYDSVSMRFNITNDRIRHILYTKGNNPAYRTFFYTNNKEILNNLNELVLHYQNVRRMWETIVSQTDEQSIIDELSAKISTINDKIASYNNLISLIEEVNAEYCKQNK